jgi:hypothetical protein
MSQIETKAAEAKPEAQKEETAGEKRAMKVRVRTGVAAGIYRAIALHL